MLNNTQEEENCSKNYEKPREEEGYLITIYQKLPKCAKISAHIVTFFRIKYKLKNITIKQERLECKDPMLLSYRHRILNL